MFAALPIIFQLFAAIGPALPQVLSLAKDAGTVLSAVQQVAPHAIPILGQIAKTIWGDAAGAGHIEFLSKGFFAPHRLTPEEENRYFSRTSQAENTGENAENRSIPQG